MDNNYLFIDLKCNEIQRKHYAQQLKLNTVNVSEKPSEYVSILIIEKTVQENL